MSKTQNHSSRAGERFAGARGSLWRPAAGAWLHRRGGGRKAAIGGGSAVVVLGVAACLLLAGAWHVRRQALEGLAVERGRVAAGQLVPFERKVRLPLGRREIQFRQSVRDVRAVVRFQDSFFAATGGGLLRLTDAGEIARHYSTLDGLTESDLTSLAVCGAKLFIGTRSQGLLAFDGEQFESYRWPDREPQAVAALLAGPGGGGGGRLLVGTFAGGLLEFDGQSFREIMAAGGDEGQRQRLRAINVLRRDKARLYVGTFDDGLWIEEAGRWSHFTNADGLPSNRVVGLVVSEEQFLVACDFGLAVADSDSLSSGATINQHQTRFHTLAVLPALSGLTELPVGGGLLLCQDGGELSAARATTPGRLDQTQHVALEPLAWKRPENFTNCRLGSADGQLWLSGSAGLWRVGHHSANGGGQTGARFALAAFGHFDRTEDALASNLVSALALGATGQLWVGTFRDGIDVFDLNGRRAARFATGGVREINALVPDADGVLAATSQGAFRFDTIALRRPPTRVTIADGLPGNAVLHLARARASESASDTRSSPRLAERLAYATNRGLSLAAPDGKLRSLTTVQGLPSNSIYAVLPHGRALYAGTLGGLVEIEAGRIVRTYTDANSKLTHNWVTALAAAAGPRLFIGTYGGGIFELTPAGELRPFAAETGRLFVNPNALWCDGTRLHAGTLDGVWTLDLITHHWTRMGRDELPAPVVLSITGDARHVYFGTTGGIARVEHSYFERGQRSEVRGQLLCVR